VPPEAVATVVYDRNIGTIRIRYSSRQRDLAAVVQVNKKGEVPDAKGIVERIIADVTGNSPPTR